MNVRTVLAVVALVWAVVASPVQAAAPDEDGDVALREATRFRAELGYETAPSIVASALMHAEDGQLELPLTPSEEADFIERSHLRDQLAAAVTFVEGAADDFGGLYFDQSDGKLVLNVVTHKDTSVEALQRLDDKLPVGSVAQFVDGQFSAATLSKAQDLVRPLVPEYLDMVAIDPVQNRVLVSGSREGQRVALDALGGLSVAALLTAPVIASPSACTSRLSCSAPWRGGTRIVQDGSSCTWGYNARASSGARFLITAGHCARLNRNVSHNGAVVNIAPGVDINTFDMVGSQSTDVLSAPLKSFSGSRNLIYRSDSTNAYPITARRTNFNQQVGDSICISGQVSALRCGVIELKGVTTGYARQVDGKFQTFTAFVFASMTNQEGDSGGPVFSSASGTAFGIVSARQISPATNKTYYSPIDLSLSEVSLSLCITSTC